MAHLLLPRPRLILLDIEGTTCPVHFVSGVLFPYASQQLPAFLQRHGDDAAIQTLLAETQAAWQQDMDPTARTLREQTPQDVGAYLQWLIQQDRKLPSLKELQGLIWQEGYRTGVLSGPLFDDVAPTLRSWHGKGLALAVYSSGSVSAQQLLYQYSTAGDLTALFCSWFDTRMGSKLSADSYRAIATELNHPTQQILFISDSLAELDAASATSMATLFSHRPGNPGHDPGQHLAISSLQDVRFESEFTHT